MASSCRDLDSENGLQLEGAFVECDVNRGAMASTRRRDLVADWSGSFCCSSDIPPAHALNGMEYIGVRCLILRASLQE
jgi:hypothetical protein